MSNFNQSTKFMFDDNTLNSKNASDWHQAFRKKIGNWKEPSSLLLLVVKFSIFIFNFGIIF